MPRGVGERRLSVEDSWGASLEKKTTWGMGGGESRNKTEKEEREKTTIAKLISKHQVSTSIMTRKTRGQQVEFTKNPESRAY